MFFNRVQTEYIIATEERRIKMPGFFLGNRSPFLVMEFYTNQSLSFSFLICRVGR